MQKDNNYNNKSAMPIGISRPGAIKGGSFGGNRFNGPTAKPKNFKGTLRRLCMYFGEEKRILFIIMFFVIIDAVINLYIPYFIGKSIDTMSSENHIVKFSFLKVFVIALLSSYILDAILNFAQGFLMAGAAQRIVKRLRNVLFNKLQKLPVSFFDLHTHGEVMSRLTNDIDNISSTISQSATSFMSGVVAILGSLIMMLYLSPALTLASIITIPLVIILTKTIAGKSKVLFKKQQEELGKLNGHMEESISGFEVVKAFNHEEKIIKEFNEINKSLCTVSIKAQICSGFLMPLMNVINNIGFAAVAGVGGILATKNIITVGVIASFLSYSRQFSRPLNDLANIFNNLQSALAGAERVFEVLDEKEEAPDRKDAYNELEIAGNVEFKYVSFGYRKDSPIIKNLSFYAKAGSNIALVGSTGAGKTTIINLLTRFYDITEGKILIDNRDIKDYSRNTLRKYFGIVLQDTYLFNGTIMENIRYGNLKANDEEVKKAASMARADLFIKKLPKAYNTLLTESGSNLSQGQRQLLSIARAILSNPSILILDEATSSVDTRTELHIQEAMIKLMKGRTSFIIAHRLSTIVNADTILVIDNGEIVEKGNHAELINKKGKYYNMFYSQFKNTEEYS